MFYDPAMLEVTETAQGLLLRHVAEELELRPGGDTALTAEDVPRLVAAGPSRVAVELGPLGISAPARPLWSCR